jgi:hypothetical protein
MVLAVLTEVACRTVCREGLGFLVGGGGVIELSAGGGLRKRPQRMLMTDDLHKLDEFVKSEKERRRGITRENRIANSNRVAKETRIRNQSNET